MFVVPKTGLRVYDPAFSDYLPAIGREVASGDYWLRRLAEGDVTSTDAPAPSTPPAFTVLASGPTPSRPLNPEPHWVRFNTTLGYFEVPVAAGSNDWERFGGAGGGGGGTSYTLPAASTTTRGGVKVGAGLAMAGDAILSADVRSVAGRTGAVVLDATDVAETAALKVMTATERTKLAGVAVAATANATDALLRDRSTHTGTQTSATIADLTEAVQDIVGALLAGGTGVSVSYNDAAGTLTLTASAGGSTDPEVVRDTIGVALSGLGLISVVVNDAADTITIATTATANSTDAALRDRSTHTGTQATSTVTGLDTALAGKAAASHTHAIADVTGLDAALAARLTEAAVRALRGQYSPEAAGRTIVDADHGKDLGYSGSAAATFTLPSGLAVGTLVTLTQDGTGKATFAAGSGATVANLRASGQLSTAGQGASIVAELRAANTWRVSGDAGA